jgi:hypothetical protein
MRVKLNNDTPKAETMPSPERWEIIFPQTHKIEQEKFAH